MDNKLQQLVGEAIKLELNIADLYTIFHNALPEDSEFWWELVSEEKKHADLIKSGEDTLLLPQQFPMERLAASVQTLCESNIRLISLLKKYKERPPSREVAFNAALDIENSTGELHFQLAMERESTSSIITILQQLYKDYKDHTKRILAYMNDNGIEIYE